MSAFSLFRLHQAVAALSLVVLAGCGGGGSANDSNDAAVSNLTAANMRMGVASTISATGRNLLSSKMVAEGPCNNLTRVASSTDDFLQYTCDVQGTGRVRVFVVDANGQFIGDVTAQVPVPRVSVTTSKGSFVIDLDVEKAPKTVLNFLIYVNAGFYASTVVDTVLKDKGFMGGAYTLNATTGALTARTTTRAGVALESNNGLQHVRGTVGMFRGAAADSGTFRWFINAADNPALNYVDASSPGYTVFGTVSSGLDIIDAITAVDVRADLVTGLGALPTTAITLTSVTQTR